MNTVQLRGTLANAPRLREAGDIQVAEFLLGVSKPGRQKDADGRYRRGDMVPIVTFGVQATNAARFLDKGRRVLIEGHIASEFWPPDAKPARLRTRVVAERIEYLDRPMQSGESAPLARTGRTR